MAFADQAGRTAAYQKLLRRNSVIGVLRLAVPAAGALILVVLIGQIYLSSLGSRFGLGQVSVTPDAVVVEAPEYAGVLEDGSTYRVWADEARAAVENTDLIGLGNASIVLNRADGVQMQASSQTAQLNALDQTVLAERATEFADSLGTQGVMEQSVFDWQNQILTVSGAVDIAYADGTTIDAEGLVYDLGAKTWTFERATVILPSTPGEDVP